MVQRPVASEFAPTALVFPGGRVDEADADPAWDRLAGVDDAAAEAILAGAAPPGPPARAFLVAAAREAFEEARVLLTTGAALDGEWATGAQLQVQRGEEAFARVLDAAGLRLDLTAVVYISRWITPEGLPRRYDTAFFAAAMPPGQEPAAAPGEIEDLMWLTPEDALGRQAAGAVMLPPTTTTLRALAGYDTVAGALEGLRLSRNLKPILPRLVQAGGNVAPQLVVDMPAADEETPA